MQEAGGDGMTSEELIDSWFDYSHHLSNDIDEMRWLLPVYETLAHGMGEHIKKADSDGSARSAVAYSYALEVCGFRYAAWTCKQELSEVAQDDVVRRAFSSVSPQDVLDALQRGWRWSLGRCASMKDFLNMGEKWVSKLAQEYAQCAGERSFEDFRRSYVLDVCCWQCGKAATLVKMRISSGFVFSHWCDACSSYAVRTRPFVSIKGTGINPESVREIGPRRPDKPCSVCGTVAQLERHHLAPYSRFGDAADDWPVVEVCRACHEDWHRKMGDDIGDHRKGTK